MKLILILAAMKRSKSISFGAQKTRTYTLKIRRKTSHCLVRIFFENEQGKAVTVNGDRYRAMLNEFLFTNVVVYTLR